MTRYLTEDHLGSPRVITDSEGNVISRRDFLPFGEEITPDIGARASVGAYQPTDDNVRQKFTGYQKDAETGLDFAEARMYENRHGRFTAVDPLLASGKSANPQTLNRYTYVMNSPLLLVDRNGEYPSSIHDEIIRAAFPGLSEKEIKAMIWGSALVDTYYGTGGIGQIGSGRNPFGEEIPIIPDFPITLFPSEAYKHAMTPAGIRTEDAVRKAWEFVTENVNAGLAAQNNLDSSGNVLSEGALIRFGSAAHTMMDATSPAHRFFQPYGIPVTTMYDENGFAIGEGYDWGRFLVESWRHSEDESNDVVSQADRDAAITLLRLNLLTSFGRTAFEKAVTDEKARQQIYDLVANSDGRYWFPQNGGVANSWGISRSNLPADQRELHRLSAPRASPPACIPGHRC